MVGVLFLLATSTAFASIYGTHQWNSTNAPNITVANTWVNQSFAVPSPAITSGVVHTVQAVGYSWNAYVCSNVYVPPVAGGTIGAGCAYIPNPASVGLSVEVCRQGPTGLKCMPVSSKSGATYDYFYGETYTSSATKWFLRFKSGNPVGLNGHLYITSGNYVQVGFSAY